MILSGIAETHDEDIRAATLDWLNKVSFCALQHYKTESDKVLNNQNLGPDQPVEQTYRKSCIWNCGFDYNSA